MRGRKRIPTNLHILHGNPGKRPLNDQEPDFELVTETPKPPKLLGRIGRRVWRKKAPGLVRLGLLTEQDLEAFADYCIACERVEEAQLWIKKHGTKFPVYDKNGKVKDFKTFPEVYQLNNFMAQKKSLGALFGFSPSDRTKIRVEKPKSSNPFGRPARKRSKAK